MYTYFHTISKPSTKVQHFDCGLKFLNKKFGDFHSFRLFYQLSVYQFLKQQEEIVIYIIYNINKALKSYYQSQKNN